MVGVVRIAVVALCLSCANPLAWLEEAHPQPFDPPPSYVVYWKATEDCVGKTGDFTRLRFHVSDSLPCPDYRYGCSGYWVAPHDIYVRRGAMDQWPVVRHEMIHDLLQGGGHPDQFFPRCEVE